MATLGSCGLSTVLTVSETDSELTLPRHEVPGADHEGDDGTAGAGQDLGHLRGVGSGRVVDAVKRSTLPERGRAVADQHRVPGVDDRRERVPLVEVQDP